MCPPWAAPPAAERCLIRPYASRKPAPKGGTVIAEPVATYAEHLLALIEVERYRPVRCLRPECGCDRLHLHERRERKPRQLVVDGVPVPVVTILVFICAECAATWRVLPAFLARCLWRTWDVVAREVSDQPRGSAPPVPARTVQRWRARLAQVALMPLQVLAVAGGALRALCERVGLHASRGELLAAYGASLASLAALLHRLAPGVRLM